MSWFDQIFIHRCSGSSRAVSLRCACVGPDNNIISVNSKF